jgi:phage FluMu protein Com
MSVTDEPYGVRCPRCGKKVAEDIATGQVSFRCPRCKTLFQVMVTGSACDAKAFGA